MAKEDNLVKARAKQQQDKQLLYQTRDQPLIERLRRLEAEVGRATLVDLVYAAVREGFERGVISYRFPEPDGRHRAVKYIRELLNGRRFSAMRAETYEAFLYAVEQLEEEGAEDEEVLTDLRRLREAIEENGLYKVVPAGGHQKLLTGKNHPLGEGKTVMDEGGPLTLPSTPSDYRWRKNNVARLRKTSMGGVSVLSYDPFSSQGKPLLAPAGEQKRLQSIVERSDRNAEQTRELRTLVEPLLAKLGSWENNGFTRELASVILAYGQHRKLNPWFNIKAEASVDNVLATLKRLHKGETLVEKNIQALRVFWTELELSPDPVERYIDLLREARGLAEEPEPLQLAPLIEAEETPAVEPPSDYPLALEVLYEMVAGRADADRERVLSIALRVLRLEQG